VKILIYAGLAAICSIALLYAVGLLLPETRSLSKTTILNAPIDKIYQCITDNRHWQYRSSLDNLQIVADSDGKEIWLETTGSITIRFETLEKRCPNYYSFKMEHRLFDGTWVAQLEALSASRTHFTATENIRYKNPIIRSIGYALMDLDKMMQAYQHELAEELARQAFTAQPETCSSSFK